MNAAADLGEMRTPIAYEVGSEVGRKAAGTPKVVYAEAWRGMAAVRPLSSKELTVAAGLSSKATHRVAIRWRPGVDLSGRFRILGTDRVFQITSALNLEDRNQWLVCQAIESFEKPS